MGAGPFSFFTFFSGGFVLCRFCEGGAPSVGGAAQGRGAVGWEAEFSGRFGEPAVSLFHPVYKVVYWRMKVWYV
uniref:Putative secreted protein n=1 Tax=Ixodes ricinus TaxID=34613 RepID=A0A6B0U317_IXORI